MKNNQFALLRQRKFLPLFLTQFLGAFNDNVYKNALVVLITFKLAEHLDANVQILVTAAAGLFILPFFLFSATAGQLADKFEKSRLIIFIKLAEIIIMLLAALGFYTQNVYVMMVILFLLGTQATFFGPIKYAILPLQLGSEELVAGNGLIEAGTFISILLGTIFGGVLILQPEGELIISFSLILLAVLGWLSSLFIPNTRFENLKMNINFNFISETMRVIAYSKARWDLYLSILAISWFWLIGAVFLAEFPVFAKDIIHADEHVVTWFIALFSVGIAIGSLLCNSLLKGRVNATYVPLGAIGMTVFAIDIYFAARTLSMLPFLQLMSLQEFLNTFNGWRISLDLLLLAVCGGLYTVPLYAILQHRSNENYRARVIASNNIMNALFMVFAALGTVAMLKLHFTVNDVFLTIALLNAFVTIYICRLLPDLLFKALLRMILRLIYRVEIIGMEHYDQAGKRVVIVANHTSFLDAILLAAFLPDKFTFAVDTQTSKKWWLRYFLNLVDAFPIDPTNPIALKSLIEHVKQDRKCVIFPEGRITVTGSLMKIYEGPGLIADKADAVLLPICIQGAQFTPFSRMRGKLPIKWAPKITLTIFPASHLQIPAEIKGRERRHLIGQRLYDLMSTIMFESCNYQTSVFSSLIDAKSVHGSRYVIAEDTHFSAISYNTLITKSIILGGQIAKKTEKGEYVGILMPNMVSTLIAFFAMQFRGRIPAMLNFTAGIKNILSACKTATIKTVYTSSHFIELAKLADVVKELDENHIQIIYLEDVAKNIAWHAKLSGWLKSFFPKLTATRLDSNAPAVILFTSGSEGTPKGVVLSHQNVQANRYQLSARIDFTERDKIFNALPVFHSFGLTGGLLLPVLSGIQVFLYPSPLHYRVIPQLVYMLNATIMFGTDTFLKGYVKHAHQYDFYSLRYVFSGAEKLHSETLETWLHKFGVRIFDGYGATETSPVLATNTPMQYRSGTVGRLLPGIQYQLKEVQGIKPGGQLLVKGPNVMKGYLLANQPNKIVEPENGWYDTGDIVSFDHDGFISILGRVKRFAKIAGEMVSLTMVEQQLNTLWPEHQHAMVSIPDEKKGEQLILVTTHLDAKREDIIRYFKEIQLTELAIPKQIIIVNAMPLLGTGKINYTQVKEMVQPH